MWSWFLSITNFFEGTVMAMPAQHAVMSELFCQLSESWLNRPDTPSEERAPASPSVSQSCRSRIENSSLERSVYLD